MSPTVPARLAWLISCALNQPMRTMLLSSLMSPMPTSATSARRALSRLWRTVSFSSSALRTAASSIMAGAYRGWLSPPQRAARGAHRVLADRADVAPHAHCDDGAVAQVAVQPGRHQAGQQCAAFVGVGVVYRQQRAADAEVVDQFALQVDRERRVVPDADLDDAQVLRPLDHAAHGCAADAQAARQLVLGLPVDEVER